MSRMLLLAAGLLVAIVSLPHVPSEVSHVSKVALSPGHVTTA